MVKIMDTIEAIEGSIDYSNSNDDGIYICIILIHDGIDGSYCMTVSLWGLTVVYLSTPSSQQRSVEYMSEVMISRRGGGSGSGGGSWQYVESSFTTNGSITIPDVQNNQIYVRIFGGGGGGTATNTYRNWTYCYMCGAGGGGGWMNNDYVNVTKGQIIAITIGKGGNRYQYKTLNAIGNGESGGTTAFGTYLSATGGTGGKSTGMNSIGGSGGASGASDLYIGSDAASSTGYYSGAGIAYQFGAGNVGDSSKYGCNQPSGGIWGGGASSDNYNSKGGNGGTYGGGGYGRYKMGTSGTYGATNTIGWTNVEKYSNGVYITGNGGRAHSNCGYGGFGGYTSGKGGGGYGGNWSGFGGSGYASNGGGTGGGGYMSSGGNDIGGGGGYGNGGNRTIDGFYGGGGGAYIEGGLFSVNPVSSNGGSGICIIQYYTKV